MWHTEIVNGDNKRLTRRGHVMSNANTLMKNMLTTQKIANKWTKNAYRTASTELYEILAECYEHSQFYRAADISFKLQLNQLLRDAKHTFNEGTRIETKVVRVVFGEVFHGAIGRSRGAIYSKVLIAAHEANVTKDGFVKWLTQQGGVEAVRKQNKGKTAAQIKTELAIGAHEKLSQQAAQDLQLSTPAQNYDFSIALVAHSGGDKRIVALLNNSSLVKDALAKAFVELEKADTETQTKEPVNNVTKIQARKALTQAKSSKEAA